MKIDLRHVRVTAPCVLLGARGAVSNLHVARCGTPRGGTYSLRATASVDREKASLARRFTCPTAKNRRTDNLRRYLRVSLQLRIVDLLRTLWSSQTLLAVAADVHTHFAFRNC